MQMAKQFVPYYPTIESAELARIALKKSISMWDDIAVNYSSKRSYELIHPEIGELNTSCYLCQFNEDIKHEIGERARNENVDACQWCPLGVLVESCMNDKHHFEHSIIAFASYQHDCLHILSRQIRLMKQKGML
jgi:hypothetical protein